MPIFSHEGVFQDLKPWYLVVYSSDGQAWADMSSDYATLQVVMLICVFGPSNTRP